MNQSQSDKARDVTLEKKKKFMEWAHGTFSQADVANSLNRATGITLPESMVHLGHGSLNKVILGLFCFSLPRTYITGVRRCATCGNEISLILEVLVSDVEL